NDTPEVFWHLKSDTLTFLAPKYVNLDGFAHLFWMAQKFQRSLKFFRTSSIRSFETGFGGKRTMRVVVLPAVRNTSQRNSSPCPRQFSLRTSKSHLASEDSPLLSLTRDTTPEVGPTDSTRPRNEATTLLGI